MILIPNNFGEIVTAICEALSRLAAVDKLTVAEIGDYEKALAQRYGVLPWINELDPMKVKFQFVTQDDVEVNAVMDLRLMSRDYIGQQFKAILDAVNGHRRART